MASVSQAKLNGIDQQIIQKAAEGAATANNAAGCSGRGG